MALLDRAEEAHALRSFYATELIGLADLC